MAPDDIMAFERGCALFVGRRRRNVEIVKIMAFEIVKIAQLLS